MNSNAPSNVSVTPSPSVSLPQRGINECQLTPAIKQKLGGRETKKNRDQISIEESSAERSAEETNKMFSGDLDFL